MTTIKINTDELIGDDLDKMVAKCEGWVGDFTDMPDYSTDWSHGGPIIEREKIQLEPIYDKFGTFLNPVFEFLHWVAKHTEISTGNVSGKDALIAAMRCYVKSKFGDVVEITITGKEVV